MGKINTWIKKLDESHLEWLGIAVILVLLAPVFLLCIRDGAGSGIFVVHDQLDETVLSYVFSVRYFGQSVYEQLMCGIDKTGLVMPSPFFMPLYAIFNVYNAFLIQYVIVVVTAFFGMYFCVRTISGSSISAFLAGALFACLPFMPIYGNVVAGTPLVVLCFLKLKDCSAKKTVLYCLLLAYYALSDHIVLTGWVALGTAGIFVLIYWIKGRKFPVKSFIAAVVLFLTYVAVNFRLIIQSLLPSDVVSHRVEFRETKGAAPFWDCLKNIFLNDKAYYYANTKH